MQYVHSNLQLEANALSTKLAITASSHNSIALFCCILSFKDIVDHLAYYLRYIDYLSLKRASKHLPMNTLGKLYNIDSFVDVRLKGQNLFDLADETNTVISGSFILRLLVSTPYQMPLWMDKIFTLNGNKWENSDIDLYSHKIDSDECSICHAVLYCVSTISFHFCNGFKWSQEHHFGHGSPNNIYEDDDHYVFSINYLLKSNMCKINNIKYNDIIISKDIAIGDFIKQEFDFDFCKNYYNNGKLYIGHPESVLKCNRNFQIKYNEDPNLLSKLEKTLEIRYIKYGDRGFNIKLQMTKKDKANLLAFYAEKQNRYPHDNFNDIIFIINNADIMD